MPEARSVAVGFWVGTGSRDEPAEAAGVSHFLEHLLFKGTEARTAQAIAEAVDEVGGEMNAWTGRESTSFELRLVAGDLTLGLDLLSDIVWAPSFRPDEVEAERQVMLEELALASDEPEEMVHDLFLEGLFPGHPLGLPVAGQEATVSALGRDDIRRFHQHHYRPGNVVVAAAGLLDHEAVTEAAAARFAGLAGGAPPGRQAPGGMVLPLVARRRGIEQVHLVVGVRGVHRRHPDRHAVAVLDHVLGGGLSSRLFQEIRERRGLAYNVYSFRSMFSDAGALGAYAGTAPRQARQVLQLLGSELDRVAEGGITERELAVAKGHVRGALVLGLEDSESRMARLGRNQVEAGDVPAVADVLAAIEAVTVSDVNRVAAELLRGPRVVAAYGPVDGADLGGVVP